MKEDAENVVRTDGPSPEAIRAMIRFMMQTSIPRIIAEERAKKKEENA